MLSKMGERSQVDLVITDVDLSETVHSVADSFQQLAIDAIRPITARKPAMASACLWPKN